MEAFLLKYRWWLTLACITFGTINVIASWPAFSVSYLLYNGLLLGPISIANAWAWLLRWGEMQREKQAPKKSD